MDFTSEIKHIKGAIRDSAKAIKFKSKVATKENFADMLRAGPRILHISCHGQVSKSNESCLVLEDKNEPGKGVLVFQNKIENLLKRETMSNTDLIFLAACHSEKIGELFVRQGIKHVVCVKQS